MINLSAHYGEDEGTVATTDPVERQAVIKRVDAGELSVRAAAFELDLSPLKVRKLLDSHRAGIPDPTVVRMRMEEGLADPATRPSTRSDKVRSNPSSATSRRIAATDGSCGAVSLQSTVNGA